MGDSDRLRWRCRRGLLELDLILHAFLEREIDRLDAAQRNLFMKMLDSPDNDLLDWALGRSEPADPRLREAVRLLREG
jgi:succinate dehydrogenase flavin-adding protein (antitoxin of CptAB toxin-antitoxin module)